MQTKNNKKIDKQLKKNNFFIAIKDILKELGD